MTIDILEIERVCKKYKGPLQVDIQFDQYGLTIRSYFADDETYYATNKHFTYDQIQIINMSLEELVEDVVDKYDHFVKGLHDTPKNKPKARWIDFGVFTNGKGFYCSNCGHRVYVLDGAYPSYKKCTNCKREMDVCAIKKYDHFVKDLHDTQ